MSGLIRLTVQYVPRLARPAVVIAPEAWRTLPGHGIDRIEVQGSPAWVTIEGQSLYWLYPAAEGWILGGVALNAHASPSYLLTRAGKIQPVATPAGMPDLEHDQVKFGWWR